MKKDKNLLLKEKFLEYYREVPIQRYAAAYVGKDEDTIIRWRKEDTDFAEQIKLARADYLKKQLRGVRSKEWILERLFKDHFAQRTEHTGKDGEPLSVTWAEPSKS